MNKMQKFKQWVKGENHPIAALIKHSHDQVVHLEIPATAFVFKPIRWVHELISGLISNIARIFYWTPLFKTHLSTKCQRLYLYGGMPLIQGCLDVSLGNNCRISGQTTFSGRWSGSMTPQLIIGNNVGIAWQTTIAVGTKVIIGDNVRIAGRSFLAGYPGHPVDPTARAQGKPDTEEQIGDIILEKDVWLGSGVTVMKGVTIGEGTIVSAGSVVTKSLPSGVLAAGIPAKVIKPLFKISTIEGAVA